MPLAVVVVLALFGLGGVEPPRLGCPRPSTLTGAGAGPAGVTGGAPGLDVPVGWEIFRRLDRLPLLGGAEEARLFSSADPAGGNADGFRGASSYLCRDGDGFVLAQHSGPGELTSLWFTRSGGDVRRTGRVRIELDGRAVVDAPLQALVDGALGPPFVHPLVGNADQSSGGVYVAVPMPFQHSMRVVTDFNPRFYRVAMRALADADGLATFDPGDPAADVVDLLRSAGTRDPKPPAAGTVTVRRRVRVPAGGEAALPDLFGPGSITALRLRVREGDPAGLRLGVTMDGLPTVAAPVGEFFGAGLRENRVSALLFAAEPGGWYRAWWPMPFARSAVVSLAGTPGAAPVVADLEVDWHADPPWAEELGPGGRAGYFHATSRAGRPERGRDWVLADLRGQGRIVGVSHTMSGLEPGRTYLEGDERLHVDGSRSPQFHGTGTEDFYLAGWYFNRGPFTTPFSGHTAHLAGTPDCPHQCDAAYRLLLPASVPFRTEALFTIEHGVDNRFPVAYSSTTFWYGRPDPGAVRTDTLDVGRPASEAAHGYQADRPGRPRALTSRFAGSLAPAPASGVLRATAAPVSFHLDIDPANRGVILRRTYDQALPFQAARVLVGGVPAGIWLQPAGNRHLRWAEDSFLLPAAVTAGRTRLDLTLEPLDPARPWTAARYEAFSLTGPP